MKRRIWGTAHKKKMCRTGCTSCGGHEFCQRQQARRKRTSRGKFGLMRWFCVCKNNNNNSKNSLRICWGKTNGEWSIVPDGPPATTTSSSSFTLKNICDSMRHDRNFFNLFRSSNASQVPVISMQCEETNRFISFIHRYRRSFFAALYTRGTSSAPESRECPPESCVEYRFAVCLSVCQCVSFRLTFLPALIYK